MAKTEVDYLRERDDKAQARIVELEGQLAELQKAVDSYLNDCSCKHTLAIALQRTEGGE